MDRVPVVVRTLRRTAVLAVLCVLPLPASAQDAPEPRPSREARILTHLTETNLATEYLTHAEELGLTEAQRRALRAIEERLQAGGETALGTVAEAAPVRPRPGTRGGSAERRERVVKRRDALRAYGQAVHEAREEIGALLSAEQRRQASKLTERRAP